MRLSNRNVLWTDDGASRDNSILGMLPLYTYKTITAFEASSTIVYLDHVVFLNFTHQFRRNLIGHRHSLHGLFPVYTPEYSSDQKESFETFNIE